ncbi:MAG: CapA family protein [Planctomycetota bacterium]|jgi:poly-gamma-glutamate synthesis protein (capsule biosynthesis protein)
MLDSEGRLTLSGGEARARLLFAGDLCPIHRLEKMLAAGDVEGAFGKTRELFRRADLAVVNLESPLCSGGSPVAKLGPNFKADPGIAGVLAGVPVGAACLANNHTMDQGAEGLAETISALDAAGIPHVGAGPDQKAACGPLVLEAGGLRIALLAFATVEGALPETGPGAARINHLRIRRAVSEAAGGGEADAVIPMLHTGKEQILFPSPAMQDLCREIVDAGAAAVVCHHPHVPQGIEVHRGRPIVYSLGNFLFDWPEPEPETDSSFLLELELSKSGATGLAAHPLVKGGNGGAVLLEGERGADYVAFLNEVSAPLADRGDFVRLWREQCRGLMKTWYEPRVKRGADVASDDPELRLKTELTFLNLMENDEHGEVLRTALLERATGEGGHDAEARERLDALMGRLVGFAGRS